MDDATANRIVLVLSIAAALLLAPLGIGTVSALTPEVAATGPAGLVDEVALQAPDGAGDPHSAGGDPRPVPRAAGASGPAGLGTGRATIPGIIEAEDYDAGGEGVAYHDVDPANLGGAFFRPADGVDIEYSATEESYIVAYMRPAEWLEYTVDVTEAGAYDVTFTVASRHTDTSFRLSVDGTDAGTTVVVPNTGAWDVYTEVTKRVTLPSGTWVMRVTTNGYHNLCCMRFSPAGTIWTPTPTPTPVVSTPTPIVSTPTPTVTTPTPTVTTPTPTPTPLPDCVVPGWLEAERFDLGGEGVGYHDATPGNSGGAVCRTAEDVDIASLEEGGYAVTGIEDGEWLAFTIDGVTDAGPYVYGPYPVELYVASDRDGRSVEVEVNGTVVRNVSVPNTGSLAAFTPVLTQFGLAAQGRHAIRLRFHGDGQALDKVVLWDRHPVMYADGYAYPWFTANRTNGTAPLTVQFTDRSSEWTYGWHWSFGDGAGSEEQHPVHTFRTPGTFTVRLQVSEESYWFRVGEGRFGWFNHFWDSQHPYGSETTTMRINVSGPVTAIPPGPSPPLDGDGDGVYEDVNGNGRRDFADVVLYYTQLSWIATNEPAAAFDYNGNGAIDFADVVWLFNHLETPTARTFTVTAVAIGPGTIQPSGAFTVREGENVTFSLRVGAGVVTPHDTQSGVIIGNYVVVDPAVAPTPQPTSYNGGQYPPHTFTSSYTLSNIQADHTVYGCFYEAGWMTC